MNRSLTVICLLLILPGSALCAAKYKISDVHREKGVNSVRVYFAAKSPSAADAGNSANWSVVDFASSGTARVLALEGPPDASEKGTALLTFSAPPSIADDDCVVVQFLLANKPVANSCDSGGKSSGTSFLIPASDKKAADLSITGSYSPALNGAAQWSIDSFVALAWDLPQAHGNDLGRLGVYGEVKTDKRKTADPDSYRISPLYQYVPYAPEGEPGKGFYLQSILINYPFAQVEFDKKGNDKNLVTAPTFEFPIRIVPFGAAINERTKNISVLSFILGAETGHNFSNLVDKRGSGAIFRGLLGVDFVYDFKPKLLFFDGFSVTSGYRLRLPSRDEVFTLVAKDAQGKDIDNPFLSSKARHHVESELDLNLNKGFSFTITHEYGELPPAFRFVDHKVSIGLSYMLQQNSGVRGAIRKK